MAYTYEKNVDYEALKQKAITDKDYYAAAQYEQQRNAKIDGEGLSYAKTNDYAGNLDQTDYSNVLKQQMSGGESYKKVQSTLNDRIGKANSAVNLKGYVNDDLYKTAMEYIAGGAGKFSFDEAPDYVSKYQGQIDSIYNQVVNSTYGDFLGTDEYAALQGQHQRTGQRAMQDTLGDVSARTGGLASSYAVTAGQQAYGNQMSVLEEAAMDMYSNQKTDKMNQLSMLQNMEAQNYNQYANELNQYNTDRNFDYQSNQAHKSEQTAYADMRAQENGDFSGYVNMGQMTPEQAAQAQKTWAIDNPEKAAVLYPSLYGQVYTGGYRGGGGGGGKPKPGAVDDTGGGTKNNTFIFGEVNGLLKNGWTTTKLGQFLREQLKSGAINQYTYDQSMSAIYVHAAGQRRKK